MKIKFSLFSLILGLAATTGAHAQNDNSAQLRQAATGAAFKIGDIGYRLVPSAVVKPVGKSTPRGEAVVAERYSLSLPSAGENASGGVARSKRSLADESAAPATKLAAAVSERGDPVVVTSSINVYFDQPSVLADAVRTTGGKLTYSSAIGGKGVIEFGSVAEAVKAMGKLQGKAGVKEVSPQLVKPKNRLY